MKKEFIPYEQNLEIRNLGFDEPFIGFYNIDLDVIPIDSEPYTTKSKDGAILYQQAFRWFREKHQCESSIIAMFLPYENYKEYQFIITYTESEIVETNFNSYEEAELACLKKLIEVVKNK